MLYYILILLASPCILDCRWSPLPQSPVHWDHNLLVFSRSGVRDRLWLRPDRLYAALGLRTSLQWPMTRLHTFWPDPFQNGLPIRHRSTGCTESFLQVLSSIALKCSSKCIPNMSRPCSTLWRTAAPEREAVKRQMDFSFPLAGLLALDWANFPSNDFARRESLCNTLDFFAKFETSSSWQLFRE